jgi:flagellar motility protein MotE (MotC chaperone)
MKHRFQNGMKTLLVSLFIFKIFLTVVFLAASLMAPGVALLEDHAIAQEAAGLAVAADPAAETPTGAAHEAAAAPGAASEAVKATLLSLEEKRLEIEKEKERLAEQQTRLESLKDELTQKIDELTRIRQEVEASLAVKEKQEEEKVRLAHEQEEAKLKQLVKVYSSMKPKNAAALIDKLDMEVVLQLFSQMKGEQIGQILTYVSVDRAALVSERLAHKTVGLNQ